MRINKDVFFWEIKMNIAIENCKYKSTKSNCQIDLAFSADEQCIFDGVRFVTICNVSQSFD